MKINKYQLFMQQAPNFNFEYNEDQLVTIGLERGYLTETEEIDENGDKLYLVNENYYND